MDNEATFGPCFPTDHEAEKAAVGQVLLNMSSTICCPSLTTSFPFRWGDVGRVENLIGDAEETVNSKEL